MNEVREDGKVEIQFNTTNILKFINHISGVSNVVATIHHLSKSGELDSFPPLETDGLPIGFENEQGNIHVTCEDISNWIFLKAFEDLIVGLTQSLIEAYSLLKLHTLSERTAVQPITSQQEFETELKNISSKGPKLNFPTLIEEIEKMVGGTLSLREDILSINQVRNCLVHKNGLAPTPFSLSYIEMRMIVRKDGELIRLTKELKKSRFSADQLFMQNMPAKHEFVIGEKITMTADLFKDVTYTCILFVHELVLKLPLPDEIKQQIIQPFKIQLAVAPDL